MSKEYKAATTLCDEILRLEPGNVTVLQFRPVLAEKIQLDADATDEDEDDEEEEGDASLSDEGVGVGGGDNERGGGQEIDGENDDDDDDDDEEEAELEVPDRYQASGIALRPLGDVTALKRSIAEHAERQRPQ
jgi:hypothetical protein